MGRKEYLLLLVWNFLVMNGSLKETDIEGKKFHCLHLLDSLNVICFWLIVISCLKANTSLRLACGLWVSTF
jgi:hypothetical protein